MRVTDGALRFAPTLPAKWRHYQFKIHIRGALLQVRVDARQVQYTLLQGESLQFRHRGERVALTQAAPEAQLAQEAAA
jgi:trehalose/maltose hydrolase-like predicted phosphorylase